MKRVPSTGSGSSGEKKQKFDASVKKTAQNSSKKLEESIININNTQEPQSIASGSRRYEDIKLKVSVIPGTDTSKSQLALWKSKLNDLGISLITEYSWDSTHIICASDIILNKVLNTTTTTTTINTITTN